MKVSIITPCYNSVSIIEETLQSVQQQKYPFIKHIIIDSVSEDGTLQLLEKHKEHIDELASEEDDIYNAINKGVQKASGDIIEILNSDDSYSSNKVIDKVVEEFKEREISAVYGGLQYINDAQQVLRNWESGAYDFDNYKNKW